MTHGMIQTNSEAEINWKGKLQVCLFNSLQNQVKETEITGLEMKNFQVNFSDTYFNIFLVAKLKRGCNTFSLNKNSMEKFNLVLKLKIDPQKWRQELQWSQNWRLILPKNYYTFHTENSVNYSWDPDFLK